MYRVAGFLFLALLSAPCAQAQALGAAPLTVLVQPEYPQPYQTITITPQSNLIDLAASTVTISVNDKVIGKGSGQSVSYQVGPAGETDIITVSAATAGETYAAKTTVRPAGVALVMEPQSTMHPFYGGGARVASEGRIRFIAVPDFRTSAGKVIDPATLVYSWKAGDQALQNASGIGKTVLLADAPMRYRDTAVSVTVSAPDGSAVGRASIDVSPIDPYILFYRDGALTGPDFGTAIGNTYAMVGDEETFRAVPYFFGTAPTLAWSVDGKSSGTDPVITVRTTGSGAGTSVISLEAAEPDSYQSADAAFSVSYGGAHSTNLFGL